MLMSSVRTLKVKTALIRFEGYTKTWLIPTISEEWSFSKTRKLISILSFSWAKMKNRRNIFWHTASSMKMHKGRDNLSMRSTWISKNDIEGRGKEMEAYTDMTEMPAIAAELEQALEEIKHPTRWPPERMLCFRPTPASHQTTATSAMSKEVPTAETSKLLRQATKSTPPLNQTARITVKNQLDYLLKC